ncbi:hypothetical protein ACFL2D_01505, partial [Patescibacteria group bacterium]
AGECGFEYLDGDQEDTEFFPNGKQWFQENKDQLRKAHKKIFEKTRDLISKEKNVVVDYIIFGLYIEFFKMFQDEFGDNLEIKVLLPSKKEMIKRDKQREGWTTGADRIQAVYEELEDVKGEIGLANYLDTTNQSPQETFEEYFKDCFQS